MSVGLSRHRRGQELRDRPGPRLLVGIALLTLLTWLSGDSDFRIARVPDGGLLSGLHAATDGWHVRGPAGTLRAADDGRGVLFSNAGSRSVSAFLALPIDLDETDDERVLRLRGRFERLGPAGATLDEAWRPRVLVRWFGQAGESLGYGAVTRFESVTRSQRFDELAWASGEAVSVELVLIADRAGKWQFFDIDIDIVELAPLYLAVLSALALAWAALFGWAFAAIVRSAPRWLTAALAGVLSGLVFGVALGQSYLAALLESVIGVLASFLPLALVPTEHALLDLAHAIGFGVLMLLLVATRHSVGLGLRGIAALGLLLALATEALQRHRPNRSSDLYDVLVDAIGIGVVLAIWVGSTALARRRARYDHR